MERLSFYVRKIGNCRSRWLSGIRCRPVVARLLGLRVRIPLEGIYVFFLLWLLWVVQVEGPATGRSFVQRYPTEFLRVLVCVCVCVCVIRWNSNPLHLP